MKEIAQISERNKAAGNSQKWEYGLREKLGNVYSTEWSCYSQRQRCSKDEISLLNRYAWFCASIYKRSSIAPWGSITSSTPSSHSPKDSQSVDSPLMPSITTWHLAFFRDHLCCRNATLCVEVLPQAECKESYCVYCPFTFFFFLFLNLHAVPHLLVFCVRLVLQRAAFTMNSVNPKSKTGSTLPWTQEIKSQLPFAQNMHVQRGRKTLLPPQISQPINKNKKLSHGH